jgi:hypothetical protein
MLCKTVAPKPCPSFFSPQYFLSSEMACVSMMYSPYPCASPSVQMGSAWAEDVFVPHSVGAGVAVEPESCKAQTLAKQL